MEKRDQYLGEDNYYYTPRDLAIKWIVITSLMVGILFFVAIAYWHAQRRMKGGMAPMGYHRWLAPRSQRSRFDPELQNQFSFYQAHDAARNDMNSQAPPPYNLDLGPPPKYQPPASSTTKVDASSAGGPSFGPQTDGVATSEPPPPSPQPPAAAHARGLRNPFR
ncbi:hypothetical protein FGG08_004352 [Glutinoglossum americanum]|uniref:Uncharacterized protein n=1 Tax=Glutinoglossum americanum TaxID=1670608 RepID=A0A9P8L413_9PEZI|nr:hypothetical protein FGG08_004352 [Glutinoglossum americanum]